MARSGKTRTHDTGATTQSPSRTGNDAPLVQGGWELRLLSGAGLLLVLACLVAAGLLVRGRADGVGIATTCVRAAAAAVVAIVLVRIWGRLRQAGQRSLRRVRRRYPDAGLTQAVQIDGSVAALVADDSGCRLVGTYQGVAAEWTHASVRTYTSTPRQDTQGRATIVVRFHSDKSVIFMPLPRLWTRRDTAAEEATELVRLLRTYKAAVT